MAISASARVFGIPELLEHILLEYTASETTLQDALVSRPVTALFVWLRVSWTFNNDIASSRALRQAMFLEHADEPSLEKDTFSPVRENTAPVEWLLSTCGPHEYGGCRFTVAISDPDYGFSHTRRQTRNWNSRMKYASASWRKIKQICWPGQKYYKKVARVVDTSPRNVDYNSYYNVVVAVNRRGTLGELYSLLSGPYERSVLDNRLLGYCKGQKLRSECGGQLRYGYYTVAQERAVLKYFDDIQKHVGGSKKGEKASECAGKTKKKGKKTTKKRK